MEEKKEYQVFCQFCAIGRKTIMASSFEEAKQLVETDKSIHFDEILRPFEPCTVTEALLMNSDELDVQDQEKVDYKSWGSE